MKDLAMNLLGQKTGPDEYELIKKDGRHVIAEISTFPVKREGKVEVVGIARDISERKEAEKAIRESQRKFEQLFMSNPEATVFSDVDDHVLDVNPRFSELFGYSHSEAKGRLLDDLIVPDDLKEEAKKLTDIREGYIYHDTVRKKKDGSLVPVSISSASITSEYQHLGNVVQYKDITERKKAEEKIRESEEKYRNLFENARDLILTVDLEGNITSANSALLEYGYSKSELLGKSLFNIFPEEYSQRFRDFFQDFAQGRPVEGEFKIQSKAKQGYSIVEYKGNPIIQNNRTVGVQVIVRDITDRKEMEEKLRQYSERLEELVEKRTDELLESENRYSVLVEEASDGVAILQDGKILFANKKGSEITGYSKDELIGLPFEKLVSEEYKHLAKERYERRLRGEKLPPTYEIKLIAKTGDQIPVELSATHIHHQGSPADLIIVRDVRERKRMEEERLRLEKLAAIGELATMVGHDLRNPLQSIGNAAYYLNNELPQLCPSAPNHNTAIEMLQAIDDSIKYADKIIRDLQDFSSIKKPTLRKTEINVTIKEALSQVKIPENVELRTELGCVPEILVDEDQMKRVFLNLATNAMQAMEKGGTLAVSTKRAGDFVEVSFRDTGVGISKENMGNIFKPLFTTKAKGMGMGLPICKKFVESHGGIINVESEVGKGTTLTVKLPVQLEHGGENH
jgi:two-component system sporulation sensor kinase A